MANNQDSIDYHNARNGDLTNKSWPGQVAQHAYWQKAEKKPRHPPRRNRSTADRGTL